MAIADAIQLALDTVRQGGMIAYPTEAVFGLGCDPANLATVERLLTLKQRPAEKGLILIAADLEQLRAYLQPLDPHVEQRVLATWPGPITWLLPVQPHVSPLIRGEHPSLAVRISAHPVCQVLCEQLGHPLISTSANLSDYEPARTAVQVQTYFANQVDYILDLPTGGREQPSEIRDALTGQLIRAG